MGVEVEERGWYCGRNRERGKESNERNSKL
jgi:hypothetical protein